MRKVFVIFKWLLAIFLLVVLLVVLNDKRLISQQIIKVSHKSGFYLKPFKLSLPTDNKHTIRYTLDGSNPTNKSEIFKTPLLITGNESYDSLSFINTTIADSIANFGWRAPIGEQDKATIVKYAGFQNGSLQTEIKTLSSETRI